MDSWSYQRISDISFINQGSYSTKENWQTINYLDTGSITENKIQGIQKLVLGQDEIPSRARRKVQIGDIVYSTVRPNQRHYGFLNEVVPNMLASTGFAVITPNTQVVDGRFLYYLLTQDDIVNGLHAIGEQSTSAYPSIKPDDIGSLEFLFPPVAIQKRISSLLTSLDDKIKLNDKINDYLEQSGMALYRHYFTENRRDYWPGGFLEDLGQIIGGSTPSKTKEEYYTSDGIAWITPKDLSLNKSIFIDRGEVDITELGLKNSSAKVMPRGTVLFSSRAPIGYTAIAAGKVTTNQGFKSIVPKEEIGTSFIYYFLKDNLCYIEGLGSGSTFKEVSGSIMKKIPVVMPDQDILLEFNKYAQPCLKMIETLESENKRLSKLRDSLLPRLMTGKISLETLVS